MRITSWLGGSTKMIEFVEAAAMVVNLGFLVTWLAWPLLVMPYGTRARRATAFPGILDLRNEGWDFGEKPQGV